MIKNKKIYLKKKEKEPYENRPTFEFLGPLKFTFTEIVFKNIIHDVPVHVWA
jgi:hypothetical protein